MGTYAKDRDITNCHNYHTPQPISQMHYQIIRILLLLLLLPLVAYTTSLPGMATSPRVSDQ